MTCRNKHVTRYFRAMLLALTAECHKIYIDPSAGLRKGSELLRLKLTKWTYGRPVFAASSRICFYEHPLVGLKWIFLLPHPVFRNKSEHNRKPYSDHLESHAIKTKAFHWCRSISPANTCQNHIALKLNTGKQREVAKKNSKDPLPKSVWLLKILLSFTQKLCYRKRQKRWKLHCTLSYLNFLYYLPIDNRYCYSTYEYCLL